jgi:hypothetical protein
MKKERGAFALNGQCEQMTTTLDRGGDDSSPTLEGLDRRRVTMPFLPAR